MNQIALKFLIFLIALNMSVLLPMKAGAEQIKLKYSIFLPEAHQQTQIAISWAEEVEKKTNGKVKIEIFAGGSLTTGSDCYEGVVKRVSDLGFSAFSYNWGNFPVMAAINLPMGYPSGKIASRVANTFFKSFQPGELNDVKVLYLHAPGPYVLNTKEPVRTLAGLKRIKIGTSALIGEVAKALGANPVSIRSFEIYEALSRGVIEGAFGPKSSLKTFKIPEVSSYTTDSSVVSNTVAMFVIMNKERWFALPNEVQKVMEEESERWVEIHGDGWDRMDEEGWEYAAERGHQMISLSDEEGRRWRKAVKPLIEKYVKNTADGAKYVNKIEELMISACPKCACPRGTYPCDTGKCCKKN
jgi:TRAP-type C4-dicarboxylate transport system substrate-binding protein